MSHLKRLEATQKKPARTNNARLKVYYGFSKINKIQKREAIAVVFENEEMAGWENRRSGKSLRKQMNIVTERYQTPEEERDAELCNRVFAVYYIFLDDKKIGGSLEKVLLANSEADRKQISKEERKRIADLLRMAYHESHPDYREPVVQQELDFQD